MLADPLEPYPVSEEAGEEPADWGEYLNSEC